MNPSREVGEAVRLRDVPGFRVFAVSRMVAWLGNIASGVALPVLVYQLTGSAALTGLLAAAESVPYLVLGIHVGALVDRWDGKRVMVVSAVVTASALATVPVADLLGVLSAGQLLVVALAGGISFVFLDAASFGTLPRIVGRERIGAATSMLSAWATILGIVVPGVVGVALPLVGGVPIVAADALLCALSAVLLARVSIIVPPASPGDERTPLLENIREGLAFIWAHPVIRPLTLLGFLNAFTAGAVAGLIVVVGIEHLGFAEDDGRLGWLYACSALGSFLGSTALARVQSRVRVGVLSLVGYGVMTVVVTSYASVSSWILAASLLALEGLVGTLVILNGIVVRQTLTPMRLQGRVNTTARVIAWGGSPLGAAVGGAMAEWWGVGVALELCACSVLSAFLLGLWWGLPAAGRLADLTTQSEPA